MKTISYPFMLAEKLIKKLEINPVEMSKETMQALEDRNLIIRLYPNRHELPAKSGENNEKSLYESDADYGPHKLIAVTINRASFEDFATHPDNEEFLLIGDPHSKPLYLAICLHKKDELNRRIMENSLLPEDFICLRVKYNDPEVSFFTMLANVPHGEAVANSEGPGASFYVTESRDLPNDLIDFRGYELRVSTSILPRSNHSHSKRASK